MFARLTLDLRRLIVGSRSLHFVPSACVGMRDACVQVCGSFARLHKDVGAASSTWLMVGGITLLGRSAGLTCRGADLLVVHTGLILFCCGCSSGADEYKLDGMGRIAGLFEGLSDYGGFRAQDVAFDMGWGGIRWCWRGWE